jgi:predicted dehydrogenase
MPASVSADCGFGRYHDIEVEDDVTATLKFADGATGVFITSTGESPGTNRLEIVGERGRLVYEDEAIRFQRNEVPMTEFSGPAGGAHNEILRNFADAILDGAPLIAPAAEGINSVELANAMLLSAWTAGLVTLPINGRRYERLLKARIAESARRGKKKVVRKTLAADFGASFGA